MDQEYSSETELVPVLRPPMVERTAWDRVDRLITVTEELVQLMAVGQFGNGGKDVQRHAMEERGNAIEVVPIPRLQMVVKNAQLAERWK